MLPLKSLLLPVTCYCWGETLLCLRYTSVSGPLQVRFYSVRRKWRLMGLTWDLQRIYNGTASEGAEGFRRISWKPVLISGMFFWGNGFHVFPCRVNEFSMMSTKSGLCKPFQENDNLSSMMLTNTV